MSDGPDAFWAAWARGALMLQVCSRCQRARFYAKPVCPHCHARSHRWVPARGGGSVYSATVVPRRDTGERRTVVLVELDEGVRVLGSLAPATEAAVIDRRVVLAPTGEAAGPITFRLAEPRPEPAQDP